MNFQIKINQKQTNKANKFINKFIEDMRSDSFDGDIHSEDDSYNSQKFINKLQQSQCLEPIEEIKDKYPEFSVDPFIALIIDKKFKTNPQKQGQIQINRQQYLQIRMLERSGAELTMAIYHKQQQYIWFEQLQVGKIYQFKNPITIKTYNKKFIIEHNHMTNTQEINYNIIDNRLENTIAELKFSEQNKKELVKLLCLITQIDIDRDSYSIGLMDQTGKLNMRIKSKDLNKKWENGLIVSQIILIQNVKINKKAQVKWIKESSLYNLEQENIFINQPKLRVLRNIKLFQQFYLERLRKFNRAYFSEEIFQSIQQLEHNFIAVCKGYFEFEITLQKKWFDYCCICNNKNLQQCEHEKDYVNEYTLTIKTDKTEQSITASMFSNISICDSELIEQHSAKGKYIIDIEKHKEVSQNYKYIIRSIVKLNS